MEWVIYFGILIIVPWLIGGPFLLLDWLDKYRPALRNSRRRVWKS